MKTLISLFVAVALCAACSPVHAWPFGPSRKEREAKAEAARIEAQARLTEAEAAKAIAAATGAANRGEGEEAVKAERGLGTSLVAVWDAEGRMASLRITNSLGSNSDLTSLSGVTIETNQERKLETNLLDVGGKPERQTLIVPVGMSIALGSVAGSNLSAPAASNVPLVAAAGESNARTVQVAGDALAKIIAEGYTGRAKLATAAGEVEANLTKARFDGWVRIWNAATGFVDVAAKRLTFTGAAGDLLQSVTGTTKDGAEATGTYVGPVESPPATSTP